MTFQAIDTLFLAVDDLASTVVYERLGLRVTGSPFSERARSFQVGGAGRAVRVELIGPRGADHPLSEQAAHARAAQRGLFAVGLRVERLEPALGALAGHGLTGAPVLAGPERWAWLPAAGRAGTDLVLIERDRGATGLEGQAFPLLRLDHLAAVAPDMEEKTAFWERVLGVPQVGEVVAPTLRVRQFRVGDAIFELLAPASPDSPLHARKPGLSSLASWEVADLESAVRLARAAGLTAPDPVAGALPGTRIATIPGAELGGMTMQLLQYVR